MFKPLKKYAVFSGRARRAEYWQFLAFFLILAIATSFVNGRLGTFSDEVGGIIGWIVIEGGGLLGAIVTLGFLIPSIAVAVRRLHDTDRSGWWLLLYFIPIIGTIALFVLFCLAGTVGENRFGEDPKAAEREP